jgi:hypothetical protein
MHSHSLKEEAEDAPPTSAPAATATSSNSMSNITSTVAGEKEHRSSRHLNANNNNNNNNINAAPASVKASALPCPLLFPLVIPRPVSNTATPPTSYTTTVLPEDFKCSLGESSCGSESGTTTRPVSDPDRAPVDLLSDNASPCSERSRSQSRALLEQALPAFASFAQSEYTHAHRQYLSI